MEEKKEEKRNLENKKKIIRCISYIAMHLALNSLISIEIEPIFSIVFIASAIFYIKNFPSKIEYIDILKSRLLLYLFGAVSMWYTWYLQEDTITSYFTTFKNKSKDYYMFLAIILTIKLILSIYYKLTSKNVKTEINSNQEELNLDQKKTTIEKIDVNNSDDNVEANISEDINNTNNEMIKKPIIIEPVEANDEDKENDNNRKNIKFCRYCGKKIDIDSSYCSNCGKKLD